MLIYSFICQQMLKCLCFRKWMKSQMSNQIKEIISLQKAFLYFGKHGVRYNCWFNCSSRYGSQPTVAPVHINENDPLLPRCFAQTCSFPDICSWTKELKTDIIRPRAPKLVCMSIRHQLFDQIHCERLFGWPAPLQGIVFRNEKI